MGEGSGMWKTVPSEVLLCRCAEVVRSRSDYSGDHRGSCDFDGDEAGERGYDDGVVDDGV